MRPVGDEMTGRSKAEMRQTIGAIVVLSALAAVVIGAGPGREMETLAVQARPSAAAGVPKFQVDRAWPKIPNNWQFGQVASVSIDAQDNVWVLQRPGTLSPEEKPRAAPPLLEFDAAGNFIQAWGGPHKGYDWPNSEHGVYVDPKGFVWIGGNGTGDNHVLKFTKAGKFVMQIGRAGQSKGNADTQNLNQPADTFVYAKTNELFVADGYGNRRVIVFDADTGKFKRMWGAFGNVPSDGAPNPAQRFLYVGNRSQAKVMILDRKTLKILDSFGKWGSAPGDFGTLHHMASDSKGNLYVTEVTPLRPENRRVQKFIFLGSK